MDGSKERVYYISYTPTYDGLHMGGTNRISALCCDFTWELFLQQFTLVPSVEAFKILVQIFCTSLFRSIDSCGMGERDL
jgi:hypothetical protein